MIQSSLLHNVDTGTFKSEMTHHPENNRYSGSGGELESRQYGATRVSTGRLPQLAVQFNCCSEHSHKDSGAHRTLTVGQSLMDATRDYPALTKHHYNLVHAAARQTIQLRESSIISLFTQLLCSVSQQLTGLTSSVCECV